MDVVVCFSMELLAHINVVVVVAGESADEVIEDVYFSAPIVNCS
jgi:hypothetical protein